MNQAEIPVFRNDANENSNKFFSLMAIVLTI